MALRSKLTNTTAYVVWRNRQRNKKRHANRYTPERPRVIVLGSTGDYVGYGANAIGSLTPVKWGHSETVVISGFVAQVSANIVSLRASDSSKWLDSDRVKITLGEKTTTITWDAGQSDYRIVDATFSAYMLQNDGKKLDLTIEGA